jgi:hypothetical protein
LRPLRQFGRGETTEGSIGIVNPKRLSSPAGRAPSKILGIAPRRRRRSVGRATVQGASPRRPSSEWRVLGDVFRRALRRSWPPRVEVPSARPGSRGWSSTDSAPSHRRAHRHRPSRCARALRRVRRCAAHRWGRRRRTGADAKLSPRADRRLQDALSDLRHIHLVVWAAMSTNHCL